MPHFSVPVSTVMTAPVVTVAETARLPEANQILRDRNISCLAVTGGRRRP